MKNILLIAITLMLGLTSFSQVNFSEFGGNKLAVTVAPGTSQGDIWLDLGEEIGLMLNANQRGEFVAFVKEIYIKSCAWDSIAKANNITDMDFKNFGALTLPGYFYYGSWRFGNAKLKLSYRIVKGESRVYLYGSKMKAYDNEYIESSSMMESLDFDFVSYISEKLSDKSINDFVASKNKVSDLFD